MLSTVIDGLAGGETGVLAAAVGGSAAAVITADAVAGGVGTRQGWQTGKRRQITSNVRQ
jgi:hypothetical protein